MLAKIYGKQVKTQVLYLVHLGSHVILLMEEILHHLTCMETLYLMGYLPYQLVSRISSINSANRFPSHRQGLSGHMEESWKIKVKFLTTQNLHTVDGRNPKQPPFGWR